MKEFLRRGGWVFLAVLFIVTALGVGVYAFVVNTGGSSSNSNYISCAHKTTGDQKPGKNGKYAGAKLVSFQPVKHVDYVQCQDIKTGTGAVAAANSSITVVYTGALANNGTIFESSLDTGQPLSRSLSQLIPGWQSAIPGMRVGGQRRIYIPAQYAYGAQATPSIPANSDLVFDVTLLAVK